MIAYAGRRLRKEGAYDKAKQLAGRWRHDLAMQSGLDELLGRVKRPMERAA